MRKVALYAILLMSTISCGVQRHQPTVTQMDSVRVEYRERIVRDTVEYKLPVIVEKHITDDTLSVIENDYAKTTAVVRDGRLSHDLQTKPAVIRIPVAVPVHDTLIVEKAAEIRTQTVETIKPLTFTQKALIRLGIAFLVIALTGMTVFVVKKKLLPLR